MHQYKTSDIAKIIGIHVNTVRLYETCGLIPKPERQTNGYRVFTDLHIEQFRLARAALRTEVLQNGLRGLAVDIVKASASGDYNQAAELTRRYIGQVNTEIQNAEEALRIAGQCFPCLENGESEAAYFTRQETADLLHITIDTLRNWELNGLFAVKRMENGYRMYSSNDIQRLKLIRSLRCANYSLSSILRMLRALEQNPLADIRGVLDTPQEDDDIITACDKLLTSLAEAHSNALYVAGQIEKMKKMTD